LLAATQSLTVDLVTAEVMTALTNAGVPSILLKGPSVALWLYPGGAGRCYVDSDILVPLEGWAAAGRVLASLGFIDWMAGTTADEQDPAATPWQRSRDRAAVDLHRSLRGLGVSPSDAWRVLSAQTEPMDVAGATVQVLTPPGRALNLALHAAHEGIQNRQCVEDLRRALDQLPPHPWDGAAELAARLGAEAAFAAGLRLLPAGEILATRLQLPVSRSVVVRLRAGTPPPLALGFAALGERPGWSAKLRFVQHNALPTAAFMRFSNPLARRGGIALGAAYAWRWLLLLWHAIPGYRAWRRALKETQTDGPG
jgi:hypothetical protein